MVHPDMQLHIADGSEDGVHNYSVNYCTLSLLRFSLKDAVRRADGDLVMAIYSTSVQYTLQFIV
jgi:hypothetical protein